MNKPFIILAGAWLVLLFVSSFSLAGLKEKNELLSEQNKELTQKANELTTDKATLKANLTSCDATLASQNEAIKAASVKIDNTPSKEVEQIKKIYVKDKGCEAELKAYKELFK
ncbi:hypothetical protein [Campylobacter hyointestinalis]|uniref:Uncharacterized protein n=1 Tax=Campylobacter hyointestinalis subsp. hyointestinalis TaxID=91352 RepID=A0A855NEI1_CAMHY|nr:hypothetical protein [Campylobacter hyointestinalis]PPB54981.1 hypothetical protein CDQ69_02650 [Campylobacter hyointestinalis subsp. hyointestinalis]PPB58611.1 hypothetical protein CDQ70_04660 [Campylobacter hyointestinalis subsp. hyointestinalis]PPB60477.1 hypothetical protein CDQ72_07765 [Campylobacter hyointestinalis subsp. hyointestinalis]PPB61891.1 hypothetical protein CDQ74_07495 [Campylobacter hyointestinalis subsp. hyointestinalis]PPB64863.1 hypothetical protein CDQ73_03260 [Campyl